MKADRIKKRKIALAFGSKKSCVGFFFVLTFTLFIINLIKRVWLIHVGLSGSQVRFELCGRPSL